LSGFILEASLDALGCGLAAEKGMDVSGTNFVRAKCIAMIVFKLGTKKL